MASNDDRDAIRRDPTQNLPVGSIRDALATEGYPWVAAENPVTQLPVRDRAVRLGVPLPDDEGELRGVLEAAQATRQLHMTAAAAAAGLPASFDARNVGGASYVTPIRNQGNCGSCVAFGSVAAMETTAAYTRKVPGMQLDLSEAHLFYTHGGSVGRNCENGWLPLPALSMSRDKGVTFEDYFPYTPKNTGGHTLNPDWPNRLARPIEVKDVTGDPAAIKEQIVRYGSSTACFLVYADFFSYKSGVYKRVKGDLMGGHCVTLIGYDDAQSCWIAKNSWDTSWGEGGFFRIGYGECGIETWQCVGVTGINLRAWTGVTKVAGLWSNDAARNAFAYLNSTGWLRLANDSDVTTTEMLAECIAAKGAARSVNAFADNGTINEIYVY
jgi:hypothetical protein